MVEHKPPIPEKYLKVRRRAVESLYCGLMSVSEHQPVTDPETGITEFELVETLSEIPCRLCLQQTSAATEGGPAEADRDARVMFAPEVDIPAGSVIEIEQHGVVGRYKCSGRTKDYHDHKTAPLVVERSLA